MTKKTEETGERPYRGKQRGYHLKHHYGLTEVDVPNACQVCGSTKKICVDHNHTTGVVRGFLCDSCNVILGRAGDNAERLRRLAEYIENHN
ncbi:MAG: endonuclease VII domain-containing protein [Nitrososphaera sp.]|nr:endonuclease VII domain-containing protein [Nitrososphaera sp.]